MIDVRSDTVTRPTDGMRQAMMDAEVGDDVYGDDPTVNHLQDMAAERLGHEAALFMPTGTQSNLVALLTHCQRGDEYIVGGDAHTYKYEGGGAAALGGIQPQTLPFSDNGELPLTDVAALIKEHDVHFARTRLLCLENTQHGRVQSLDYMRKAQVFCQEHNLMLHLDGARMGNTAIKLGVSLEAIGGCFDTVSLCLSKGLGAPVGSLLFGNRAFIEEARRWRKVTGGGLRQAGILAAAGIIALTDGMERLQEDHDRASFIANKLSGLDGVRVREGWTQTNMVWLDIEGDHAERLSRYAKTEGLLLSVGRNHGRIVLHRDVSQRDAERIISLLREYFQRCAT
ncbi:MAG: low-specificity L-threonine aldolase [Granulosicoccus sp.]